MWCASGNNDTVGLSCHIYFDMKSKVKHNCIFIFFLAFFSATLSFAGNDGLVAWWAFDDHDNAYDKIKQLGDTIDGNYKFVEGVNGRSVKFNEFDTFIKRSFDQVPAINPQSFTIEAWVAPRSYPWNWCPIVTQSDSENGFYFGIDADGRFGLHVSVNGKWQKCNSAPQLPGLSEKDIVQFLEPKPKGKANPVLPLLSGLIWLEHMMPKLE